MTSSVPWQLKGVRREVIDTAHEAARRSGVSVAEWLDSVISESARDAGVARPQPDVFARPAAPARPGRWDVEEIPAVPEDPRSWRRQHSDSERQDRGRQPDFSDVNARLERLSHQLDELAHASAAQSSQRATQGDDPRRLITDALSRLDGKIERMAEEGRSAGPGIDQRVGARDRAPGRDRARGTIAAHEAPLAPIDEALAEIGARQRALDGDVPVPRMEFARAPTQRLPDLEHELRQINARIESMRPCGLDRAVETVRDDLAEIGVMLKDAMPRQAIEALQEEVRSLSARLDDKRHAGADGAAIAAVERGLAEVHDALRALAPAERFAGLEETVRELSRKIDRMGGAAQDPAALKQLEGAIVALRGVVSQVASHDALAQLSEEVRTLSAKVDQVAGSDMFSNLERRISSIAEALEAHNSATADTRQIEAVMRGLSDRVERLALQSPGSSGPDTRELEAGLHSLSEKVEWLVQQSRSGAASDTREIEAAILGLAERVERLAVQSRSDTATDRRDLEAVVHNLSDKIERLLLQPRSNAAADTRDLEATVRNLADQIEKLTLQSHAGSGTRDLEAMVHGLSDRIEMLHTTRADQAAVGHLEDQIVRLVEKLEASDTRLNHLDGIERGLVDLLNQIENQRAAVAGGAAADSQDANALKRDVQRTQDSLESVHGTLGLVVDRLATIESSIRDGQRARETSVPAEGPHFALDSSPAVVAPAARAQDVVPPPTAPLPALATAPAMPVKPEAAQKSTAATGNPSPAAERRPIDPNLPPDHPLEPGAARSRGSPADRIAASEAALENVRPPVIPDPGGKSNFIAAARRAAQAAMVEAPPAKDKPAAQTGTSGSITGKISDRLRKLMVGAGVILLVLGALHFAATRIWFSGPANVPPSSQTARDDRPVSSPAAEEQATPSSPERQSVVLPPSAFPPSPFSPGALATVVGTPTAAGTDADATGSVRQPGTSSSVAATPAPSTPAAPTRTNATDRLPAGISAGLRAAAANGDAAAEFEIASRLAEGRGVPQDLPEAAAWFERAAAKGLVPAQFRLGGLYEKGLGVTKDSATARRLYLSAAEAGNAKAMHNLAVLYAEGADGKPDYESAARWFRKAADHGVLDSQYNLAVLYARGIGVETNLAEAFKWFALASREGDRDANRKRDDVAGRLDKASLTAAMAAAQGWQQQPQPDAAVQVAAPNGGWDAAPAPASAKRAVGTKGDTTSRR